MAWIKSLKWLRMEGNGGRLVNYGSLLCYRLVVWKVQLCAMGSCLVDG